MTNLNHLAIIMDGNGRWATQRSHLRSFGHSEGAKNVESIISLTLLNNIKYLTLYAFSSENWRRPKKEVSKIFYLFEEFLDKKIENLHKKDVKISVIGDLEKLSQTLQQKITKAVNLTKENKTLTLYIAFSYGGRDEILKACNNAISVGNKIEDYNDFRRFLYSPDMPDIDLVIRTGGHKRISNFLLWHVAYAELYFTDKYWPEFNESDFSNALCSFNSRKRNFGTLK